MTTREEALNFGLSFPDTYKSAPFHDENWQLVRVKGSKKAFLWTYERNGYINLNVKVNSEWRDFWRDAFESVIPGWHQNKENWNTIILDGSIPDEDVKRMITESYEIVIDSPTKRIYEAVKKFQKERLRHTDRLQRWQEILKCRERSAMLFTKIRIRRRYHVFVWSILKGNFREPLHLAVKMNSRGDLRLTE